MKIIFLTLGTVKVNNISLGNTIYESPYGRIYTTNKLLLFRDIPTGAALKFPSHNTPAAYKDFVLFILSDLDNNFGFTPKLYIELINMKHLLTARNMTG